MTLRLTSSSLAGTLRKLVAVGTVRLRAMLAAIVALTPRMGVPGSSAAFAAAGLAGCAGLAASPGCPAATGVAAAPGACGGRVAPSVVAGAAMVPFAGTVFAPTGAVVGAAASSRSAGLGADACACNAGFVDL